jgi:hypothetical protein
MPAFLMVLSFGEWNFCIKESGGKKEKKDLLYP